MTLVPARSWAGEPNVVNIQAEGASAAAFCRSVPRPELARQVSSPESRTEFLAKIKAYSINLVHSKAKQAEAYAACLTGKYSAELTPEKCRPVSEGLLRGASVARDTLIYLALMAKSPTLWSKATAKQGDLTLETILESKTSLAPYLDSRLSFAAKSGIPLSPVDERSPRFQEIGEYLRMLYLMKLHQKIGKNMCEAVRARTIEKELRAEIRTAFLGVLHETPVLRKLNANVLNQREIVAQDLGQGYEEVAKGDEQLAHLIEEMNIDFDHGDLLGAREQVASRTNWTTNDFTMALLEYSNSLEKVFGEIGTEREKQVQFCADWAALMKIKVRRERGSILGGATVGLGCLSSIASNFISPLFLPLTVPVTVAACSASVYEGYNGMTSAVGDKERAKLEGLSQIKTEEEVAAAIWDGNVSAVTNGAGIVMTFFGVKPVLLALKGKAMVATATALTGKQLIKTGMKQLTDPATSLAEFLGRGRLDSSSKSANLQTLHEEMREAVVNELKRCQAGR